jgi:hypothetical protein
MKIPARIAANPDEADWADDALLTLPEGAALLWPAGPITTATLRTAAREGSLAIVKIAGKHFVTKAALKGMGAARPPPTSASAAAPGRYKKPVGAGVTVGEAPRAGTDPDYDDLIAVLDVAHERLCALRAAARAGRS